MSQHSDVTIIGGGIIGAATAYYLSKRGVGVTLFEKDEIAHEQSGRAWGFVRQQRRHPAEVPLMAECIKIWPTLGAELDADLGWTQAGILAVASTHERLSQFESWQTMAREFGVESEIRSVQGVRKLLPDMQGAWSGGLFTAEDGHADPALVTRAFANAAEREGARIITGVTVDAFDTSGGQMHGLRAGRQYFPARTVICAAGIWSSKLARPLGLSIPQIAIRQTVIEAHPNRPISKIATTTPEVSFRQRPDGALILGRASDAAYDLDLDGIRYAQQFVPAMRSGSRSFRVRLSRHFLQDLKHLRPRSRHWHKQFEAAAGQEPLADLDVADRERFAFMRLFPHIGEIQARRIWGAVIDATPDNLPVLGEDPALPGFIWATGFSGHGFGLGPIVGKLLAQLVDEGKTDLDLSPFRPERFGARTLDHNRLATASST